MRRANSVPVFDNTDLLDPTGWNISVDHYELAPNPFDREPEGIRQNPANGILVNVTLQKRIDAHDVVINAEVIFADESGPGDGVGFLMDIVETEVLDFQPRGALVQYDGVVDDLEELVGEYVVQHVDASVLPRKVLMEFRRDHEQFSRGGRSRRRYNPYR